MTAESKGRDLFIVDTRVSGWTGLRYLEEWPGIAKAFDIATGDFEIGELLALDGKWQPLAKMRILMGAQMTHRTRKARRCITEEKKLVDIRIKVERHIKNTYLKRVDAPVGVKPAPRCWMELNE